MLVNFFTIKVHVSNDLMTKHSKNLWRFEESNDKTFKNRLLAYNFGAGVIPRPNSIPLIL